MTNNDTVMQTATMWIPTNFTIFLKKTNYRHLGAYQMRDQPLPFIMTIKRNFVTTEYFEL